MAKASDPEAFTKSERLLAVEDVLRQRTLKHGKFAKVPERQYTDEQWDALPNGATIISDRCDLAEWSIHKLRTPYTTRSGESALLSVKKSLVSPRRLLKR